MESKWRDILQKVESGELTPEEGAQQMASATRQMPLAASTAATAAGPASDALAAVAPPASESKESEAEVVEDFSSVYAFWKNWWIVPLSVGAVIFVLGASLESWANASQRGFWMFCGSSLLLGAGVIVVSFWSRTARWLHVRVRESGGAHATRVAISMPIPTTIIGWLFRMFGRYIPGLRDQPEVTSMIPEMLAALDKSGDPLVVEVNDKNGDEVRVYIM